MNTLKLDVIKKVLMLDTKEELQNILDAVGNAISKELDQDDKNQKEFAEWKAKKKKEEEEEIPF